MALVDVDEDSSMEACVDVPARWVRAVQSRDNTGDRGGGEADAEDSFACDGEGSSKLSDSSSVAGEIFVDESALQLGCMRLGARNGSQATWAAFVALVVLARARK